MIKDTLSNKDIKAIAKSMYELQYAVEVDYWVDKQDKYTYEQYEYILFEVNTDLQIANLIHFGTIDQDSLSSQALSNLINLYDDLVAYEYLDNDLGLTV